MDIEWDPAKARSNLKKHGVSFSDVEMAFSDLHALVLEDEHSEGETRYVLVGTDSLGRIVVVVYTYRDSRVRIISARRATKSERTSYEKGIRF